jgi:serine/threonine protein kinase
MSAVPGLSDNAVEKLRALVERPDTEGFRYDVRERLGEGGMGVVYLARDRELGRDVALKVLRAPEPSADETARLLREARILATLEHPGIVPVHDAGVLPDGRVFYVMKHVRGQRLDAFAAEKRARDSRREIHEILRVFRQVCEAVAFAHDAGVLHRDLKPQNVMLGAFGEVLVLDWGVAKMRGEGAPSSPAARPSAATGPDTDTGTAMGTPGYMAPEQQAAGRFPIDERVDVYGLGGILEFLLTGNHPDSQPAGSDAWDSIAHPLRAICERARAADPAMRYRSAKDLSADIANYIDALPVTAHREGPLERARRVAGRYRTPILLVLAYLVMRIALIVYGRLQTG